MTQLDELKEYFYQKGETFTKDEVGALVSGISSGNLGIATSGTNPAGAIAGNSYNFTSAGTYANFLDQSGTAITIPAPSANQAIGTGILFFNGTYWKAAYNLVSVPAVDLSNYSTKADTAAVAASIPPSTISKNLYDLSKVQMDIYQPSTTANFAAQTGWAISPVINITPGTSYYISGNLTRKGIGMYNAAGNCVRYIDQTGGLVVAATGEVKMVLNVKSSTTSMSTNVQVEVGTAATSYAPYGATIPQSAIAGFQSVLDTISANSSAVGKMSALGVTNMPSLNLLNPATVTANMLLGGTGVPAANASYDVTDFIPVSASTLYTVLNINGPDGFRNYALYDANKTFLQIVGTAGTSLTTTASAAFVRLTLYNAANKPGYTWAGYGLFAGAVPTFQIFGDTFTVKQAGNPTSTAAKASNELAVISDVKNLLAGANVFTYELAAGNLKLTYGAFGSILVGVGNSRGFTGNDVVNFTSFTLAGITSANGDDAAPLHIMGATYGANHGNVIYNATINAHGLTNTAIGRYWTDSAGTKFYVVRIVTGNVVAFLGQNNGTPASPLFPALAAGTLTRAGDVSLTVTAVDNTAQLWPSINNLAKRVVKNGIDTITTDSGSASYIDVIESYEVMSVDDILNNLIARAGVDAPPVYTGSSVARVENTYRFLPNGVVLVMVNIKALQAVAFSNIMASQAAIIGPAGSVQFYIPNSSGTPVDLRTPNAVAWSNAIPALFTDVATAPEPTNPPNRVIEYYNNLGFIIGMLKTRGVGKALQDYTTQTFEIRNNSGKIYPHPVDSKVGAVMVPNKVYNMVMYRAYTNLANTRSGSRLSYFNFNFEGFEYVFADYSAAMTDKINLSKDSLNGKKVSVLEATTGTTLLTDTYQDGVYISAGYTAGKTASIVLIIG